MWYSSCVAISISLKIFQNKTEAFLYAQIPLIMEFLGMHQGIICLFVNDFYLNSKCQWSIPIQSVEGTYF